MSPVTRNIHLEEMDGFEFENLCKVIFERLDYGEVELQPPVGDGGKDLLIFSPQGKIVVECKHQPNTSIGRPIVQKLHSATISEGAVKGIVVTTGKFSRQAMEHASELSPTIELVDMAMLRDLASRAGIHLMCGKETAPIHTYHVLTENEVSDVTANHLSHDMNSHPAVIGDVLSIKGLDVSLRPVYRITYTIDAVFATTVGVLHRECSSGQLFIDGCDGVDIQGGVADYFASTPYDKMVRWEDVAARSHTKSRAFQIQRTSAKEKALGAIIQNHTQTIVYQGRNNQRYTKICAPTRNDIFIDSISQEYIPEYQADYLLAGRSQKMMFAANGTPSIHVVDDSTATCPICRSHISGSRSLCNECGLVTCTKSSIFKRRRHALQCEICGMTLCPHCASYVRRSLLLKKIVCSRCGDDLARRGKRVRKLLPAR